MEELDLRATRDVSVGFVSGRNSALDRINALLPRKGTDRFILNRVRVDVRLLSDYGWTPAIDFRKFVPDFLLNGLVVPLVNQIVLYNLSLSSLSDIFWAFAIAKPSLRLGLVDKQAVV